MNLCKRVLSILFALTVAFAPTAEAASFSGDVRVYVNGMRLSANAIIYNDSTYVPLRAVSEALGAEVGWDGATRSASVAFTEDDAIAKLVADVSPSVVTIIGNYNTGNLASQYTNPTAHGSGVIYKSNGHIITNAHVVNGITNLTVVLNDGTLLPGKVLYSDTLADLAIVKVEKLGLQPITFAEESTILSGKTAIAIGTPISLSMRNSVTKGIVSGVGVALPDSHYKLIQTDAAINPGNSGGPLINTKGELIGINSSKYASVEIDAMGFAIPVDTVAHCIHQYETYGRILRPTVNFALEESWEAEIGLPTKKGLTVKSSSDSSILKDDVITAVNGVEVHSIADWNEAIKDSYNGKTLLITYTRGGVTEQVTITA